MPKPKDQRFIRISVVQSEKPIREILALAQQGFETFASVETEWKEGDPPEATIWFPSIEVFYESYSRELPYYESILQILSDHPEFNSVNILSPQKKQIEQPEESLFCILRYETNDKTPIRKCYEYMFKIAQMLGMQQEFEEINNGFLLFYKRALDFELSLQNFYRIDDMITFLKDNDLWTPQNEALASQISKLL